MNEEDYTERASETLARIVRHGRDIQSDWVWEGASKEEPGSLVLGRTRNAPTVAMRIVNGDVAHLTPSQARKLANNLLGMADKMDASREKWMVNHSDENGNYVP